MLLSGPSGAGKSRLARRLEQQHGWPVVALDDFYRDGDDEGLPRSPLGIVDWDNPASWHPDAALKALRELCTGEQVDVPRYDISTSRSVGSHQVTRDGASVVVAEGVFAAHVIADLRAEGLLADAWCIRQSSWLTFWRRLVRDLAERRKPPWMLVRRGLALQRSEPTIVARDCGLGARPMNPRTAEQRAPQLVAGGPGTPARPAVITSVREGSLARVISVIPTLRKPPS